MKFYVLPFSETAIHVHLKKNTIKKLNIFLSIMKWKPSSLSLMSVFSQAGQSRL